MFKKKPLTTRVYRYYREHQSEVTEVVKPLSRVTKPVSQVILSVLSKLPISLPHRHDPAWKRTIKHWRRRRRIVVAVAAAFILLVLPTIYLTLRNPKETEAAPWATTAGSWTKRKQVTLTNNSGQTFEANTTYAVNINTQELVSAGYLNSDCSDLRIYYQPDENTTTKLAYYFDTAAGATNCSDSTSTKVYFALQANLSNSSSTGAYYIYYGNTAAASEASVDAFDIGSTQALMVCPFNGDTECINGDGAESPTTKTGAIRYGGSKSALSFDGTSGDLVNAGSDSSLDDLPLQDMTIEGWVIRRTQDNNYPQIVSKGWYLRLAGSSNPTGLDFIVPDASGQARTYTSAITADTWVHFAVVWDASTKSSDIYVNGVLANASKTAGTDTYTTDSSSSLKLAGVAGVGSTYFRGSLDEVRISDIARYTSNFTPQTAPFVRDEHTKLLLHFDENGDDPRNTGKAIDDSGNGNHGTITGAKYVAGLVGVDASTSDSGNIPSQSYADHSGVFIEEGTTNLVTNPSFENGTAYDINWSTANNVLRDEFTTNESSPIASPRTAEPGPGTFTSTISSPATLSISGSKLYYYRTGGGTVSFNDSVSYQAGRTLFMSVQKNNGDHAAFGFSSSSGFGLGCWGKNMVACGAMNQGGYAMGLPQFPYNTTTGPYRYAITMTDEGYLYWLYDNTRWRFVWFQSTSVSGSQNWSFTSYAQDGNIDNLTISDLPAPFTDNDNITNINVASPGTSYTASGVANGVTYVNVTAATGVDHELIVRRTDDNNKWVVRGLQSASQIKLIEVNGGTETERASASVTWTNGVSYRIGVIHDSTNTNGIYIYVNDNNAIYYENATFNSTATGVATGATGTYSNLKQFPRGTNNEYSFLNGEFVDSVSQNTTAPYVKFGSKSAKLDNSANELDGSFYTQVTATAAYYTLSAYVYNGTSGSVGGTVDASVAALTYSGADISTSYTDAGGGWWRLTALFTASASPQQYGIKVKAGKTVYIDGVQLEQTTYPTTYTDGSLGTGYSWSGSANASTSSRTTETLSYTTTSNINNSAGTIALWYKPNWSTGNSPSYDYIISNSYHADDHLILQYRDVDDKFVFSKNDGVTVTQNVVKDHWYYVVAAWDASNVYLSINGSAFTSSAMTASNLPSTFTIGNKVNWTGIDAGITVSDLVTYNNKLTDTQVADLYYSGLGSHQVQSDYTERFSGTEAPVLTWHLDEGYGTTAHDTTIKGNDGTISGAVWASDTYASPKQGKSLQFDGSNDYVYRTYSSDGELDPGTLPFSVSTWFKSPSSTGAQRNLISRYNSSGYKLYMNTSGKICFAVDDDSTWSPDDSTCTEASLADSKWHLATAVRDTSTISVFIDGVQAASTATTITGHLSGSAPTLYVGIDSNGSSNPWSGFIDEVRVYNHALTRAEILAEVSARGSVKGVSTAYATQGTEGSLGQGLVGYWKMDETSWNGTAGEVKDANGNGNAGTRSGDATTASGKYGNGGTFDGTGDYVDFGDPDSLALTNTFTFSTYIKPNSYVADEVVYFGGAGDKIWIRLDSSGKPKVYLGGTSNPGYHTATNALSNALWSLLTTTYDGTTLKIYINGVLDSTFSTTGSLSDSGTQYSVKIGSNYNGGSNYFQGSLDEARIYNRALSPAEVQALYNYAPGPVAEYKFDEGTGQSAYDSSGNGNTGTLGATGGAESTDPTWTQGKFGKALNFDGTDDYASAASFTPANSGTIGLWVKPDVVANRLVGSNGNFEIRVNTGQIQADIFESTVGVPWTSNISANTWTYLTVTWDNSGTFTRKLYFNGVLEVTNTNPQDSVSTTDLSFGTTTGSGEYFDGTLDNVKIYNYVRTPQQIVEDMNAGHPAPGSPVGSAYVHYKFDEMQGSTANNSGSSGSGKNGSITSGTWTKSGKQNAALTLTAASSITATISSPGTTNTFALWVYPTTSAASKTIVSDGTDTLATDSSSRPTYGGCTGTAISTDTWTHIIAVSNGSGSCSLYQNGALTASSTTGVDFGTALNIGASSFVGSIDDFKLYTVAMTADQAKTESNQGTAAVLGAVSTDASGNASWSSDRSYCPPGDTTGTCGPVAEYKFDEKVVGDAQTIIDTSGNGYTATTNDGANNTGMSCATPGKYGASCTFDAVDDLITSTNVAYKSNSTGTVTAWFKNLTSTGSDVIFWLGDKDVSNTYVSIELRTSNVIRISNRLSGTWEFIKETGTNAYTLGVWNHLAIVQNGTAPKMYLNGKEMSLSDVSAPSSAGAWFSALSAIDRMSIGAAGFNTPNAYYDGSIDQVKVFNYAFTPEQVAWDYNQGKPLAYYKFDECTGATLHSSNETYDSNLNATWTGSSGTQTSVGDCSTGGTAWGNGATGKSNGSLNFDGTDDKVQVVQPVTQARFSYSFWMKPSSLPGSSAYVVSEGFSYTNTNYILLNSSGDLDFRIFSSQIATSNGPITTGNWYHIVGTYDGTNGKLYINGQLVKTAAATKGGTPDRFSIGGGTDGTNFFTGQIDEVKVYSYALSQQQILTDYNAGAVNYAN